MRLAQLLDDKELDEERENIILQVIETTSRIRDDVVIALHDCGYDPIRAIEVLMDQDDLGKVCYLLLLISTSLNFEFYRMNGKNVEVTKRKRRLRLLMNLMQKIPMTMAFTEITLSDLAKDASGEILMLNLARERVIAVEVFILCC